MILPDLVGMLYLHRGEGSGSGSVGDDNCTILQYLYVLSAICIFSGANVLEATNNLSLLSKTIPTAWWHVEFTFVDHRSWNFVRVV